jgi:PD-(D/E)XK endonuclease
MEHPKDVGDRSMLAIVLALELTGFEVFLPLGENTRCDLVIDDGSRLARVQCKTGRLRKGAVRFKVCSSYAHHPNPKVLKRDYLGEVDYFGIYCRETEGAYLIPIEEIQLRWEGALRVDEPRNNQHRRIRFAADYQIARVGFAVTAGLDATAGGSAPCA